MTVVRFRSKPVEIDAVQFDGTYEQAVEIVRWSENAISAANGDATLAIETLEGTMVAQPGDWIVKGLKGEFYPVKPDIMDMKYEPITPANPLDQE